MSSAATVITRWFQVQTGESERLLQPRSVNIVADRETVYSYGHHFALATTIRNTDGTIRLFLLNGDTYSNTTAKHQSIVRSEANKSGHPALIVPFSALDAAGIVRGSIVPSEILPDRWTPNFHTCSAPHGSDGSGHYYPVKVQVCSTCDQLATVRYFDAGEFGAGTFYACSNHAPDDAEPLPIGRDDYRTGVLTESHYGECEGNREHVTFSHHLGASVFRANVTTQDRYGNRTTRNAVPFISAFDEQEARPLYFLAELPPYTLARTYDEALTDLRPKEVQQADSDGVSVTRQGDMFAIPSDEVTMASLRKSGAIFHARKDGGLSLFGTAHTATLVAVMPDGTIYARGVLYHDPSMIGEGWRERDHARRKIADGKTWAKIVPNTVPRPNGPEIAGPAVVGNSRQSAAGVRAWTMGGRAD